MSEIRPDYCIALRMIALQEHHREAQGWLSEYLEGDDMMRAVAVSDYNALLDRCIALRAENEKLRAATTPICVGRGIIGILAKEGAWTSEDGASVIAADELFQRDPYEEIEKLRAALKPFLIEHWPEHNVYGYKMVFVTPDDLRAAAAALKETGDE